MLLLLGPLILVYYPTFGWFWYRWFRSDSYYSHGPLIPFVSGLLIWLKRGSIPLPKPGEGIKGGKLGISLLIFGLSMHLLSAWMRVYFSSGLSLLFVVVGLVIYLLGLDVFKSIWFPLVFLVFMIPAPVDLIAALTLKLKLLATGIGSRVVGLFTTTIREGNVVYLPNATVAVGAPCSGLRSIISLLALGSLYVHLSRGAGVKKLILLFSTVPIALLTNAVRVVLMLIVADQLGEEILANNLLHKGFGLMTFILGIVLLFGLARSLKLNLMMIAPAYIPCDRAVPSPVSWKRLLTSGAMMCLIGFITIGTYSSPPDSDRLFTADFPLIIDGWTGREVGMSDETYKLLETRDAIYREYRNRKGELLELVIVYSRGNRKVVHPPDVCFQGGGWRRQLKDVIPVPHRSKPGLERVNRLILDRNGMKQVALYWYKIGSEQTSSYLGQQVRYLLSSLLRRNRSIALVRISSYAPDPAGVQSETQKLLSFAALIAPLIPKYLP